MRWTMAALEQVPQNLGGAPLAYDDPVRDIVDLQRIHRLLPEEYVKARPGGGRSGSSVCVKGI